MNQQYERRIDPQEYAEVRKTADMALILINSHEKVCADRYNELRETGKNVASALKYVHIGIGICITVNFFVGMYVVLHH